MSDELYDQLCKKCGARIDHGEPEEHDLCEQCYGEVSDFQNRREKHQWVQQGTATPKPKYIDGEQI